MKRSLLVFLVSFFGTTASADPAASVNGDQLMVYQGDFSKLGSTPLAVALKLASFDVVAISHVRAFSAQTGTSSSTANWANPSKCQDSYYADMPQMLKALRQLKPSIRIFGYVAPTADAPYSSDCGNALSSGTSWSCPNGDCKNFKRWVDSWLAIENPAQGIRIDGFLVDLVASQYLTPQMRDSAFQYIKSKNKYIMANTPTYAYNIDFAAESAYFGTGDYALVEGFFYGLGQFISYNGMAGPNAAATYQKWRQRGKNFRLAALPTERWAAIGETLNCSTPNNYYAYSTFVAYFEKGNVYQYSFGDLGINSGQAAYCYSANAYSMIPYYPPFYGTPTP